MTEPTPTKTSKVTILSDIVLNPSRVGPQIVNSLAPPPLAPLSNKDVAVVSAQNVSNSTNGNNNIVIPSTSNTGHTRIQLTGESLKRKSVEKFANQESPKKPKLQAPTCNIIRRDDIGAHDGEAVFNYMTGSYEKVIRIEPSKSIVIGSPEKEPDIKDEVTILENAIEYQEPILIVDTEGPKCEDTKEEKSEDTIEKIKSIIDPEPSPSLDDKKPTVTIDLTDDDDTESTTKVQNNIFIQNVLALQSAITMHNLVKTESDSKVPLQNLPNNLIIQNSPIKNPQANVLIKSADSILQNSVKTPGTAAQPLVLVVQNNSPLVTHNPLSMNTNLQNHFIMLPNNLNIQTKLPLKNKHPRTKPVVSNLVLQADKSPIKTIGSASQSPKKPCRIAPRNIALQNISTNSNGNKTSLSNSNIRNPVQILQSLVLSSGYMSTFRNKLANAVSAQESRIPKRFSQNIPYYSSQNTINSSQNLKTHVDSSQDFKDSSQNATNSSQDIPCSSQNITNASSQNLQIREDFSQGPENSSQDMTYSSQNLQILDDSLQDLENSSQNIPCSSPNITIPSQNLVTSLQNPKRSTENPELASQNLHTSVDSSQNLQSSSDSTANSSQSLKDSDRASTFAQDLQNALQNFLCQSCSHKARSKRDLILHIYDAHLRDDYELNLRCKICSFETYIPAVMEKHDLGHGIASSSQEKFDGFCLSSYVEIKIRPTEKKDENIDQKESGGSNTDAPVDVIELADSEDEISSDSCAEYAMNIQKYRCFDCNFTSSKKRSLQNHAVRHTQSKFRCTKHDTLREACPECYYQSCLLNLEKSMFTCETCGYRTCRKQCFDAHIENQSCRSQQTNNVPFSSDSESDNDGSDIYSCFHCSFVSKSLNLLKYHTIKHFGGEFRCDLHRSKNDKSCKKCIYEMILKDLKYVIKLCQCGFKCLDDASFSKHKSNKRNCTKFRKTLVGSSMERYNETVSNIAFFKQKCEEEHQKAKKTSKELSTTNRDVGTGTSKSSHETVVNKSPKSAPATGDFGCFHCKYIGATRYNLKRHAAQHCKQAFRCNLHPNYFGTACKKCVYKKILEEVNKEALSCQNCEYSTMRRSSLATHELNKKNCGKYRKKLEEREDTDADDSSKTEHTTENGKDGSSVVLSHEVLICDKCNYEATERETFRQHEESHGINRTVNKVLLCQECGFRTFRQSTFDRHKSIKNSCERHRKQLEEKEGDHSEIESETVVVRPEVLICANCNYRATNRETFRQHEETHNIHKIEDSPSTKQILNEKAFNCFDCNKFCAADRLKLKVHAITHYKKKFSCDKHSHEQKVLDCEKCIYFTIKSEVQKELLICNKCSYKTLDKTVFQEHQATKGACNDYIETLDDDYIPEGDVDSESDAELEACALRKRLKSMPEQVVIHHTSDIDVPNQSLFTFKCFECDLDFANQSALEEHVIVQMHRSVFKCEHQSFHKHCKKCVYEFVLDTISGSKTLSCKFCGYKCSDLEGMQRHIDRNKRCKKRSLKLNSSNNPPIVNGYKCYDCGMEFESRIKLFKHAPIHGNSGFHCSEHESDRNDCNKCLYAFIQRSIHPDCVRCFECPNRTYNSELELKNHIELSHKASDFKCDLHEASSRSYSCTKCTYAGMAEQTLKKVLYSCVDCKKSKLYSTWKGLRIHINLSHKNSETKCSDHRHISKKPFLECNTCLFEKLLFSLRSQEKPVEYQCYDCPFKMPSRDKLDVHVRIMHEHSTFQCTTHSLGDIDDKCGMCGYESIVVLMNS